MAAAKAFDKILDCVKSSSLNFCMQVSPFSATISLKKTFIKDKDGLYLYNPVKDSSALPNQDRHSDKTKQLEDIVEDLKSRLAESVTECERAYDTITGLEIKLKIKQESEETKENDLKIQLEKKTCEIGILCTEKKQLHDQLNRMEVLMKDRDAEIQNLQKSLKASKCAASNLNKKLVEIKVKHEDEIKMITKNFKSEIKTWKKDLGIERSEKLKTEKKLDNLEKDFKQFHNKRKVSNSCQTNDSPDVPYLITEPLPPIFGSQLLQKTKIQHISRSLPNLASFMWVKVSDDDLILDAAEEALNEQFDREVENFYEDAKAKATVIRDVDEENCIWKLFDRDDVM